MRKNREKETESRIFGENVLINQKEIDEFYRNRGKKFNQKIPYVSMLLQDNNPKLAKKRDQYEKNLVLPLLNVSINDRVLDIGCGVGRWAEVLVDKVNAYHGIDPCESLIKIALERFKSDKNVSFQILSAQNSIPKLLEKKPPHTLIISAGVLLYLNENDCEEALNNIILCCDNKAQIYIRIPIAINKRMTLINHWSDELNHRYSAIYRTKEEYLRMIRKIAFPAGFSINIDQPLYPAKLNNREETHQHIFILSREG